MASNPKQGYDVKKANHFHNKKSSKQYSSPNNNGHSSIPDSNDLMNDVVEVMDCPICTEYLHAPIFMCETGHNLCGDCKKGLLLPVCPLCKSTVTSQRNFALEAISSKISVPCANVQQGCKFKSPANKIEEHMKTCLFKPIECPINVEFGNCSWKGLPNDLVKHFEKNHPKNYSLKPGQEVVFVNFDTTMPDQDVQLISYDNSLFLYHVNVNVNQKIAYWTIQMIGSEKEALKWRYDFAFYNNKMAKYMNVSEKCLSYEIGAKKSFEEGTCTGIPLQILKTFLYNNGNFTFKFFIKPVVHNTGRYPGRKAFQKDLRFEKSHTRNEEADCFGN